MIAPTPGDAERWLTDLALPHRRRVALYPQREALGEEEPHYEIAGERAETIEALLQGRLRILVTTARATAERTLVPAALERLRLRLAVGERRPPADVAEALSGWDTAGCRPVTEVAEFSVRGGILDVYGFGMAVPARLEWWGDDISSIRGFDLTTQRSLQELSEITVLPVSTRADWGRERRVGGPRGSAEARSERDPAAARTTLLELLPSDTLIIEEAAGPDADEVPRAWNEAEHHLEVARRLGEDVPSRSAILAAGALARRGSRASRGCCSRDERPAICSSASSRRRRSTGISTGCARCSPARRPRSSCATTRGSSSGWRSC